MVYGLKIGSIQNDTFWYFVQSKKESLSKPDDWWCNIQSINHTFEKFLYQCRILD